MANDRANIGDVMRIKRILKYYEDYSKDYGEIAHSMHGQLLETNSCKKPVTQAQVNKTFQQWNRILEGRLMLLDENPERNRSWLSGFSQDQYEFKESADERMKSPLYKQTLAHLNAIRFSLRRITGEGDKYPRYDYTPPLQRGDDDEKIIIDPIFEALRITNKYQAYIRSNADGENYVKYAKATLKALQEIIKALQEIIVDTDSSRTATEKMKAILTNQLRVLDGSYRLDDPKPPGLLLPYSAVAPRVAPISAEGDHKKSKYYQMNQDLLKNISGNDYNYSSARDKRHNQLAEAEVNELKSNISEVIGKYISPTLTDCCPIPMQFSIFGHHHDDRAKAIRTAIGSSKSLEQIRDLLKNQRDLLMNRKNGEVTPAPRALHVNARWTSPDQIINKRTDHQNSGYFKAIDQAIQHYDDHCPSHLRVNEPDEEPGKARKIVQQISGSFAW